MNPTLDPPSRLPAVLTPRPPQMLKEMKAAGIIFLFHPTDTRCPILRIPVFPSSPDSGFVGLPIGLILDVCYVIAKNTRGQLVTKSSNSIVADESSQPEPSPDQLLVPGQYIFFTVGSNGERVTEWAVCPTFAEWILPSVIPKRWRKIDAEDEYVFDTSAVTDVSETVKTLDGHQCILTGAKESLQYDGSFVQIFICARVPDFARALSQFARAQGWPPKCTSN
ncbi:hypothetical protein C8R45DRAFT_1083496, partial [Mycena sanguinolenta]